VITRCLSLEIEHIIVDNGSNDGTAAFIEECYSKYVTLIKNEKNEGFARANLRALQSAKGRYILFLNPDMQIYEGYLDDFIAWANTKPSLGIASCKLVTPKGSCHPALRPIRLPHLLPYLLSYLGLQPFFCTVHPDFSYPDFDDDKEQAVDVVRGSFMLMRKEVIDSLGGAFDKRYFILFEDVDLCRQMKEKSLPVFYTPQMSCIDYFGASFDKKTPAFKYKNVSQSLLRYVIKWHSPMHMLWLIPLSLFGYMVRFAIPSPKKLGYSLKKFLPPFKV
jgi:GT2 family glycosyltransferase